MSYFENGCTVKVLEYNLSTKVMDNLIVATFWLSTKVTPTNKSKSIRAYYGILLYFGGR